MYATRRKALESSNIAVISVTLATLMWVIQKPTTRKGNRYSIL